MFYNHAISVGKFINSLSYKRDGVAVQELMFQSVRAISHTTLATCVVLFAVCSAALPEAAMSEPQVETSGAAPHGQHQYSKEAVANYNNAVDLHRNGHLDRAIDEYRAALDVDEQLEPAWHNLGSIYASQGHYDEAINSFKKALAIKRSPITVSGYADVLFFIGKTAEAVPLWQEALMMDPTLTTAAFNLAHALERAGKTKEAQEIRSKYGLLPSVRLPSGDYLMPDGQPLTKGGS